MQFIEYDLLQQDKIYNNPLGCLTELNGLLGTHESDTPYTLQQSYFLAYYLRSLLSVGRYT
jgi:hypothetical protein